MKTLPKAIATSVLLSFGLLASTAALADYRGHGYGHGHGHGGNVRFGISIGVPVFGPRFYPSPYYGYPAYTYPEPVYAYPAPVYAYPPVVVQPSAPPVYIEREAAPAASAPTQSQNDWYYCAESKAYYPYVAQCPAGWQRVPAQAPAR